MSKILGLKHTDPTIRDFLESSPWKEILGHLKSPFRLFFFLGGVVGTSPLENSPEIERIFIQKMARDFSGDPPKFQVLAMTSGFPAYSGRDLHNVEEFPPQQLTNETQDTTYPVTALSKHRSTQLED